MAKHPTLKKVIKVLAVLLVCILIFWILAAGFFMVKVTTDSKVTGKLFHEGVTLSEEDLTWLSDSAEAVELQREDGTALHGYFAETAGTDNLVIVLHGYSSEAANMVPYVKQIQSMGYNVLFPDLRGHGNSEDRYIGMGYTDSDDILLWIQSYLKQRPNARIALYGISMGAATVMFTSGKESLPSNVKVAVEDCGYTSVKAEFKHLMHNYFLPAFPTEYIASGFNKLLAGYTYGEASCLEAVEQANIPMLFIHGTADTFVPSSMVQELYQACTTEKELLLVEGAGHYASASTDPDTYWSSVQTFLAKYM